MTSDRYEELRADLALVRTAYPGAWDPDPFAPDTVYAEGLRGGPARLADVRGWGYLTGGGHGALGLPGDDARAIQDAVGRLIASAPALLDERERMVAAITKSHEMVSQFDCGSADGSDFEEVLSLVSQTLLAALSSVEVSQ